MAIIVWEMWVAAADERVCGRCARLGGLMFRQGEGPHPPLHPFCRCARVPAFTQEVGDPDDAPGAGGRPVDPGDLIPKPETQPAPPEIITPNPAPQPVPAEPPINRPAPIPVWPDEGRSPTMPIDEGEYDPYIDLLPLPVTDPEETD